MKLLVATRSEHKLREIRRILAPVPGIEVVDLVEAGVPPSAEEDALEPYETFEENARSKARYFRARSGLWTVADDSGLEVDALSGRPGVRTKRFAPVPEDTADDERDGANNLHLLRLLEGVPPASRTARYVCVVALEDGSGGALFRGTAEGRIGETPFGEGGFGYDPLFFDPALGRTFAQIPPDAKDQRSHRGAAFRQLAEHLMARTEGQA